MSKMKPSSPLITCEPWLAPEVINFIKDFLAKASDPKILEFGAGCSTVFFTTMMLPSSQLISIEHSPIWFESVQNYLIAHELQADLRLVTNNYYEVCYQFPKNYFDLILLDGKDRMACLQAVRDNGILKPGGVVILDDAQMRAKYQVADDIMQAWPKIELSGWKQNPLHLNDEPVYGMTKCWFRPIVK